MLKKYRGWPKPHQKLSWIVYLDDLDKVGAVPCEHTQLQKNGIEMAGNKIIGYCYGDEASVKAYGEQVLCPEKKN